MANELILVVDDDRDIRELVKYNLEKDGFRVLGAATGEEALATARAHHPELMILDLMLPGIDGLNVCKLLKNDPDTARLPVLMLSAKGEEADIVAGLELGADDYVTKPFSPRVLMARVRAILRKAVPAPDDDSTVLQRHGIRLDPGRREVTVQEQAVALTFTEFSLLRFLMHRPGRVFTRNQIINGIRGDDYPVTARAVDVQILSLRRKLGEADQLVDTVRGVGYRFKE